ncbi:MAG: DUF4406 domain-containing protein [Thermosipho sp. (in: Bacteria)]|nr:DUF4406 domain-containing protein [Thermosipho sp. (in: thermotogales)]
MRIFVSHPYANNPELNKKKVEKICRYLVRKGYIPISPIHLFSFYKNDQEADREEIMNICRHLIRISDEVWIYGDSPGCRQEKIWAKEMGKPIRIMYEEDYSSFEDFKRLVEENDTYF